jgi:peroxiredoxin
MNRDLLRWLFVGFVALAGGCSPANALDSASAPAQRSGPPDFELSSLDGSTVRLSEHLGKEVVLLDFWATYCEPCLRAMPALDALYAKYKPQGFLVLGVSIDGSDQLLDVRSHVQKLNISFPILLDQDTRVVALYNPKTSAPFSVLIARDGAVLSKHEGYAGDAEHTLETEIRSALAQH